MNETAIKEKKTHDVLLFISFFSEEIQAKLCRKSLFFNTGKSKDYDLEPWKLKNIFSLYP